MKELWQKLAEDRLRNYALQQAAVHNIPMEIKRLELAARGIRSASADGSPTSHGGSGREEWLLSNLTYREELRRNYRLARLEVQFVGDALSALTQEEQKILEKFYISPERGAAEWLCNDLGLEKTQIYSRRDEALRKFTLALYGK